MWQPESCIASAGTGLDVFCEFKIMAYYVDQRDWTQSSRVAETTVMIDVLPQDVSEMQRDVL